MIKTTVTVISLGLTAAAQAKPIDHLKEIHLASEAAPQHITAQASFLAFENGRFTPIKQGTNNFTCLVMRSPEGRFEPACLNEQAVRSILPTYEKHMQLRWQGLSKQQTMDKLAQLYQQGQLPTAETAALVFMMSSNNRGAKMDGTHYPVPSHQMYFFPKLDDEVFSINGTGVRLWQGYPHLTSLIVDVSGTQGSKHQH